MELKGLTIAWKYIIQGILFLALIGTIWFQYKEIKSLNSKVDVLASNNKSYMQGLQTYFTKDSVLHAEVITQQQSIAQMKYSKDPTQRAILDSLKRWKISTSSVTQVEQTGNQLVNKKVIPVPTEQGKLIDSVYDLSDRPHIIETVKVLHDSLGYKLSRDLQVNDTETRVYHTHKETINPPSKIFFIRWFQKKQLIEQEDITHSNPYMKTLEESSTHVVK